MAENQDEGGKGISKVKLAIGAASLFLFIVGVKRTFRSGEGEDRLEVDAPPRGRRESGAERDRSVG